MVESDRRPFIELARYLATIASVHNGGGKDDVIKPPVLAGFVVTPADVAPAVVAPAVVASSGEAEVTNTENYNVRYIDKFCNMI